MSRFKLGLNKKVNPIFVGIKFSWYFYALPQWWCKCIYNKLIIFDVRISISSIAYFNPIKIATTFFLNTCNTFLSSTDNFFSIYRQIVFLFIVKFKITPVTI